MSDIFVSYSRKDEARAKQIIFALEKHGYDVWWDRDGIGGGLPVDDVIEEAITNSRCVLVLWSNHSTTSKWVKNEAGEGEDRDILVTVRIDRVKLPFKFRHLHATDMQEWDGEIGNPLFHRLIKDISRLVKPSSIKAQRTQHKDMQIQTEAINLEGEEKAEKEQQTAVEKTHIEEEIRQVSDAVNPKKKKKIAYTTGSNIIDDAIKRSLNKTILAEGDLESVKALDLSNKYITDACLQMSNIINLKGLQELNLYKTRATDSTIKDLWVLTNLQKLHLGKTKITDAGLDYILNLYCLETIYIGGTAITDFGLNKLLPPSFFHKVYRKINDPSLMLEDLGRIDMKLPKLQTLFVDDTYITDNAIYRLKKKRPGIKINF